MSTQTSQAPLAWRLLDQSFRITACDSQSTTSQLSKGHPFLVLGDGTETTVVSIDPALVPPADGATADMLWRGVLLDHPNLSLPTRTLARLCTAMDAAGVLVVLASLPGNTMLLFPASLAGRALAALHQAGVDRTTI